ncbi:5-methyltetrahydropteroyltriglutamate--homocysteine S-methyltransferase [Dyadobacter chenwenxiniae]|uniref:5-methyltetrahydropteroyltriglutamate--homocysteine methyltransferase n=1 Tax=Dyadobacter chenwenxiniae TaxID=2906456 RepID=A0A9X1THW9_9BACT|nr:5-methyltetrahydropteroyltriglutamate--homocysteine S-methyltransferase [Dyadobacter chenwenxiniae]MCF0064899.1 5-methyltetrahydropteroyltriglutamate--homocysteine S-methyltransferase [Dyadobacter chenwenxiniae]UON83021.1 5-methyltetrahydropteroyltriglutamate--homocysteine S-methyltransferase [Dyadobacter chenwenxiniae]
MLSHNLGYPRVGSHRELKKASEQFWAGKIDREELQKVARKIRHQNWETQRNAGIDLIPSNDFSLYDHVLDTSLMAGAIPGRYHQLLDGKSNRELDLYYAMARGVQRDGVDIKAMEMTKWFDTNYHYLVPEFTINQKFSRYSDKIILEFEDALQKGILTKPVLVGPVTYLLSGKEKEAGFDRIDLLDNLLPVYISILKELASRGAEWVQLDEPALVLDLTEKDKLALQSAYTQIREALPKLKVLVTSYFGALEDNLGTAASLNIDALHIDLTRGAETLPQILADQAFFASTKKLSLGVVDGRNIWKNDLQKSLDFIKSAVEVLGENRVMIAPSSSLLHSPHDLELEKNEAVLTPEIKNWMAFAKQKLDEVATLKRLATTDWATDEAFIANQQAIETRRNSALIHKPAVKARAQSVKESDFERQNAFPVRQAIQIKKLQLPLFPSTTIGSFPQTDEVRQLRANLKKGTLTIEEYEARIREEIVSSLRWQEKLGIDVLVHGEFERNDMVEYFGESLSGFVFTQNGWVQSYGSRCVKPPVIFGDVERPEAMTVKWSAFAQANSEKLVKGMLTGPVTILQWSFVRDDQPRKDTAFQIGLAIRDEVVDLEKAGIKVIQIDEPAIREGLPLRKHAWNNYLKWAVDAFRLSAAGVADQTQIHTHMCYSEFNDIIDSIAAMDADVITIETSRSQMELLDAFANFNYPNEIGPGVYDIHSPRVPTVDEMIALLEKALKVIPARNLWVNPDCGLKTRKWPETEAALQNMIIAANILRESVPVAH